MSSETKKAAYRCVASAIADWLTAQERLNKPRDAVFAEVERIRDAMFDAGVIPVAQIEREA